MTALMTSPNAIVATSKPVAVAQLPCRHTVVIIISLHHWPQLFRQESASGRAYRWLQSTAHFAGITKGKSCTWQFPNLQASQINVTSCTQVRYAHLCLNLPPNRDGKVRLNSRFLNHMVMVTHCYHRSAKYCEVRAELEAIQIPKCGIDYAVDDVKVRVGIFSSIGSSD